MRGKKSILFLSLASWLLLVLGWVMAFYAYPRLPQEMPLWLNFFGQQVIKMRKSPLFFIYPLAQTLFFFAFWFLSRVGFSRNIISGKKQIFSSGSKEIFFEELEKESVYLALIFFNLIFIHIQRSIILLAHQVEKGVDEFYFYTLFGILLILIPYSRLRKKFLIKGYKSTQ